MSIPTQTLTLEGEIDLASTLAVTARLEPLLAEKTPHLTLDFSKVSYIDSSGLALLVDLFQRMSVYGGNLVLANLRPAVRKIFEISSLDRVFTIGADPA